MSRTSRRVADLIAFVACLTLGLAHHPLHVGEGMTVAFFVAAAIAIVDFFA